MELSQYEFICMQCGTQFPIFLVLRYSNKISAIIGKNGVLASSGLMAIILAAIAANMIHGALLAWGIAKF